MLDSRPFRLKGPVIPARTSPRNLGVLAVGALLVSGPFGPLNAEAQVAPPPPPTQDSVSVIPGEAYEASSLYRTLIGSGYRDLWTTPIRVPVADMSTLGGGGLTPIQLGGGTTTQTLQLRGADRRRYVFRSVDKTPRELLEDLEGPVPKRLSRIK